MVPPSFPLTRVSPKPGCRLYLAAATWQGGVWRRKGRMAQSGACSLHTEGDSQSGLSPIASRRSLDWTFLVRI